MFDAEFEFLVIRKLILSLLVGIFLQPITVLDHTVEPYLIFKSLLTFAHTTDNFYENKYHSWSKIFGTNISQKELQLTQWVACLIIFQVILLMFMVMKINNHVYNSKVFLVSFFLSHSWSKKYYRSSLTVHRDDLAEVIWNVKKQDLTKYSGFILNQLTTKYPKRYFKLPDNIHA